VYDRNPTPAQKTLVDLERDLRKLHERDLRIALRDRGLNPAGGKDQMVERLLENWTAGDVAAPTLHSLPNAPMPSSHGMDAVGDRNDNISNNYVRPQGQNVDNFLTDRPSSRVLKPPGGGSSFSFY